MPNWKNRSIGILYQPLDDNVKHNKRFSFIGDIFYFVEPSLDSHKSEATFFLALYLSTSSTDHHVHHTGPDITNAIETKHIRATQRHVLVTSREWR